MTTVVVGTGYTGLRLLRHLPANSALGVSRNIPADTAGRSCRSLDLDGPVKPLELPPESRILYTVPPARTDDTDRRLERFLDALALPPARIVYLSTTGVYGDCSGRTVTESRPVAPASPRTGRRVAAENTLQRFGEAQGTEITILRVPGIYGPDRLMIDQVRERTAQIDEAESNPGNRIHVDDLVTACLAALDPARSAGIFNVGDGDMRSSTWFASEVARQLGLPLPPTISRREAEKQFSPLRLSFLSESRRVDTTRMREVLGVSPRYTDPAAGISASLAEMGLAG